MDKLKKLGLKENRNYLYIIIFALVIIIGRFIGLDSYVNHVANLSLIYVILAQSMNLINGFTGMFSLGHAGFMAIGAYTVGILTMSSEAKEMYFLIEPVAPWLKNVQLPFLVALLIAGVLSAVLGLLIALPVLRLTDDYLAIATLGFAEIILVFIRTQIPITNGALGLKAIPQHKDLLLSGALALITIVFMILLTKSSYGRALMAIRDDEIAAAAVGVKVFRHKVISFTIASFFAGIGGGMLAALVGTISPVQFQFILTFNILLIVVLGGMGNIWGNVISAVIVTAALEWLRILDETSGLPGLRMVVFSAILMLFIIFRRDDRKPLLQRLKRKEATDGNAKS